MKLTIVGCGDAFSSGARLQSAYLLEHGPDRSLIDCGATTMVGLQALKLDPNSIRSIVITHLHGDHFAGLIWFIMQGVFVSQRALPLAIFGPAGIEARVRVLFEAMYPALNLPRPFEVTYHEMHAGTPVTIGNAVVTPFEVEHPSGAPSHAVRIAADGKVFSFTGDAAWSTTLINVGRNADFYLMECSTYKRPSRVHLNWVTISKYLDIIGARRTLLTHLSTDMLARRERVHDPRVAFAEDGAVYDF